LSNACLSVASEGVKRAVAGCRRGSGRAPTGAAHGCPSWVLPEMPNLVLEVTEILGDVVTLITFPDVAERE